VELLFVPNPAIDRGLFEPNPMDGMPVVESKPVVPMLPFAPACVPSNEPGYPFEGFLLPEL